MALHLSRKHHKQLLDWAQNAGNRECCGLLMGHDDVILDVERTRNVAPDAEQHFEIDPTALIAAHKCARDGGYSIIGYFHSHPNGLPQPSATDVAQAADDGRYWLIIAEGVASTWKPRSNGDGVVGFDPVKLIVEG